MKSKKLSSVAIAAMVFGLSASVGWAYSKPIIYRQSGDTIVFKDEFIYSPHGWQIVKAIALLRHDGYAQEADLAEQYLLPMLEGVTFNDVWGDADLAGSSILDYYVPNATDSNFGFGGAFLSWDGLSVYKNDTQSFQSNGFYGYGNAAEHAQYRYDYARRIYLGKWGTDAFDTRGLHDNAAGWVVDGLFGQDDPQDGRWAQGTTQLDSETQDNGTGFGQGQTPASALLDLLQNHSRAQVVFPSRSEDALSTLYVPTKDVFDHAPEWLDDHFNHADDVEAYNGYDGHGFAVYANWTLDAGGNCPDGDSDCASPMILRLPVNSKAHAFFQLGWSIHLLEDQTTPVHTSNSSFTTFEVHNDIERRADEVIAPSSSVYATDGHLVENELPALDLASFVSLYQYPPTPRIILDSNGNPITINCPAPDPSLNFKPRWYTDALSRNADEGVAHAYVRDTAEITHQFLDYIECINTEDDRGWDKVGFFTAYGLDLGVKSVAGLIRQFIEDIDQTPPTITITEPAAATYSHTGTLTLNYSAADTESGVKSVTATLDGQTSLAGHGLDNNQVIDLLAELAAGDHQFVVTAADNAGNNFSATVNFSIVVTPQSIMDDVNRFLSSGAVAADRAISLLAKLKAAAAYRAAGDCVDANATYQAFIHELNAQSGKKVTTTAAATMISDALYLIGHCP